MKTLIAGCPIDQRCWLAGVFDSKLRFRGAGGEHGVWIRGDEEMLNRVFRFLAQETGNWNDNRKDANGVFLRSSSAERLSIPPRAGLAALLAMAIPHMASKSQRSKAEKLCARIAHTAGFRVEFEDMVPESPCMNEYKGMDFAPHDTAAERQQSLKALKVAMKTPTGARQEVNAELNMSRRW